MRSQSLKNWKCDLEVHEGMLLFAQLWEEMLFDYTQDSFKVRTFNVIGLCEELIDTYKQFENGVLRAAQITPITEELSHQLEEDEVVKVLLGAQYAPLLAQINQWSVEKPSTSVSYAASSIAQILEKDLLTALIAELEGTLENPKEKQKISSLSGSLLTELLRRGFSAQFIYFETKQTFFGWKEVTGFDTARSFLSKFLGQKKQYEVVCQAPYRGRLLVTKLNENVMLHQSEFEPKLADNSAERTFAASVNDSNGLLVFPKVVAYDPFGARERVTKRLSQIASLLRFLIHRLDETSSFTQDWLVYELGDETKAFSIPPSRNVSFIRPDVKDFRIEDALEELLKPVVASRTSRDTVERILSALSAHSAGINSTVPENQFVSYWRAFETLVGSNPEANTIQTILTAALPVLSRKYFIKLASSVSKDIRRCLRPEWDRLCTLREEGETLPAVLGRLLSSSELETERNQLYAACEGNPLLKNRIFYLSKLVRSGAEARKALRSHEQRVRWHIQRMYRVRNSIIHASRSNHRLPLLTENLHAYFDYVFMEVCKGVVEQRHHAAIEMVFHDANIRYSSYKSKLDSASTITSPVELANTILFGGV